MFVVRRPSPDRLGRLLADVRGAALTYDEVGATEGAQAGGDLPSGYHHQRVSAVLGTGDAVFARAAEGVRRWRLHRGQGFTVHHDGPGDPPVAVGTEVLVDAPLAPVLHVLAACRVVWVADRPDRFGFGYGTLPVHPESGEEAFVVDRDDHGEVAVTVTAFSRPHHPLTRLGGPVARWQQARATRGYVDALRSYVAAG